jgi:hypothetical protein
MLQERNRPFAGTEDFILDHRFHLSLDSVRTDVLTHTILNVNGLHGVSVRRF